MQVETQTRDLDDWLVDQITAVRGDGYLNSASRGTRIDWQVGVHPTSTEATDERWPNRRDGGYVRPHGRGARAGRSVQRARRRPLVEVGAVGWARW
jgi:hypothetical protein